MRISIYIIPFGAEVPDDFIDFINKWDINNSKHSLKQLSVFNGLIRPEYSMADVVFICSPGNIGVFIKPVNCLNTSRCIHECNLSLSTLKQAEVHDILDKAYDCSLGEYLQVDYRNKRSYIRFDQIVNISVTDHSLTVNTMHETLNVRLSLNDIEDILPSYFIKCSRSDIININYIATIIDDRIRMQNATIIYIPKSNIKNILKKMSTQKRAGYPKE